MSDSRNDTRNNDWSRLNRRMFLGATGGFIASTAFPHLSHAADDRPPVTNPRATAGDTAVEPDWDERLTITVGPKDADICGENDRALQAAVDYIVARVPGGGGTVKILPGVYRMANTLQLRSNIRIVGSGLDSVLVKNPSVRTKIVAESDWYDQEITVADASSFRVGDGIVMQGKNSHHNGPINLKRTIVARSGNRLKVDTPPRESFWEKGECSIASLFALIDGDHVTDITIENLTLDGNRENSEWFDGNYGGAIFLQDCARVQIRNVTARNYNGDGFSFQIAHDVFVEDCHVHDNKDLGIHPGSGSQRPLMRRNKIERCGTGVFFCWGIRHGLAEKNTIIECAKGISIGHRDTDNLIRDNEVIRSGEVGILFRPERGKSYQAHRNRVENNRVIDTGGPEAVAVDLTGAVEKVQLVGNELRETREPAQRIGVRLAEHTADITLENNTIEGFATPVLDLRPNVQAAATP